MNLKNVKVSRKAAVPLTDSTDGVEEFYSHWDELFDDDSVDEEVITLNNKLSEDDINEIIRIYNRGEVNPEFILNITPIEGTTYKVSLKSAMTDARKPKYKPSMTDDQVEDGIKEWISSKNKNIDPDSVTVRRGRNIDGVYCNYIFINPDWNEKVSREDYEKLAHEFESAPENLTGKEHLSPPVVVERNGSIYIIWNVIDELDWNEYEDDVRNGAFNW